MCPAISPSLRWRENDEELDWIYEDNPLFSCSMNSKKSKFCLIFSTATVFLLSSSMKLPVFPNLFLAIY
jgi:hypothetical protein